MFYVYLLINNSTNEKYIGCTNDLKRRMNEHNSNKNHSTSRETGNWLLIYYEAYQSKEDAFNREKRLKHHGRAKQELLKRCLYSLTSKSGAG